MVEAEAEMMMVAAVWLNEDCPAMVVVVVVVVFWRMVWLVRSVLR